MPNTQFNAFRASGKELATKAAGKGKYAQAARDEIARRQAKSSTTTTPEVASAKVVTKAQVKAAHTEAATVKAQASIAWKAAFDAAEDGDRKRSAGKAYRLVLEGTPLAKVLEVIGA